MQVRLYALWTPSLVEGEEEEAAAHLVRFISGVTASLGESQSRSGETG